MTRSQSFLLAYALYTLLITFFLIYILESYNYLSVYLVFFILSFFYIGAVIIKEFIYCSMFSLRLLFNLFGILYANFYIVSLITSNKRIPDYTYFPLCLTYLAIISFNISYSFSIKKKRVKRCVSKYKIDINFFNNCMFLLFVVSLAAEFYVIISSIGIVAYLGASRSDQTLMRSDYSILTFYKHTIPMISAICLYLYLEYKNKSSLLVFVLAFILSVLHAVISVSRTEMLAVILPVLFLGNKYGIISRKNVVLIGVLGFLLFGVWKSLLASNSVVIQYDSEFVSWYEICQNIQKDGVTFLFGRSYLDTIINLIIPVTGTETLSTWYVKEYEYDVYLAGGGRGFSAVFEAYMNFNFLGVIMIYGFYGWLFKKIDTHKEPGIYIYMIVLISLHLLFRADSYSFWKNMMWFRLYPMFLIYYASLRKIKHTT